MEACGLELIGDQMKLLKVLNEMEQDISFKNHNQNNLQDLHKLHKQMLQC